MLIGLLATDSYFPNLALMKISSWHKEQGDTVEWYTPFEQYDIVYMSKIFSFTPDYGQCITNAKHIRKGGTGYDLHATLPEEMEFITPDYSLYPRDEQYALSQMESLMVSTVQQLQCVMDHIGDRTMVDKATDYIRRELFRFMPFVESDMKEDIINKFRKAMEE